MSSRIPFDPQFFQSKLTVPGYRFSYFPSIDSTNLEARRYLNSTTNPQPGILVADLQLAGRGRLGRSWQAPPASGLMCTVVIPIETPLERAFLYTASMGLAVKNATARFTDTTLQLKWPNDLLREGLKVGGILAELEIIRGEPWLALGFGLNISLDDADLLEAGIVGKAGNLVPNQVVSREELLAEIIDEFSDYRHALLLSMEHIRQEWAAALVTLGHRVQVFQGDVLTLEGLACGVDDNGTLVVEDDAGEQHRIQAGDVSVRLPGGRYSA
ncbi:MAG: biotin--[acetyl-CoA-carboxylase] ligase [Chloroflexi bacterium]|uniref:biotin--[biotin carboxyl-carrier protein] ligase n=1 Tax=Candidatus Chlorohelix allophototropha TaxID=3003348 RepID=A0A8T7LT86_9CHLR|nr:biotin--[acetyl-CoA-carboxylase] ligase [Chloroflexota bacterium]WJW67100.1 biotin--[acetyl-CoA-carboxylase] ligase [Chloroflexota bacterium L227-S17]